jgi:purine nucleosidase/pyrimidine-specific ribonucleoside hydrolase
LIDTDTGVDDALAILYALHSPRVKVEAVTTVAGNVEVEKCTRNVGVILDYADIGYRPLVAQGARAPLMLDLVTAPEVHGTDGLGNTQPPIRRRAHRETTNAVECIRHFCELYGNDLTIVALGPLTNIALAWKKHPRELKRIDRLVSMGGAFHVPGNTGPVAEFNYFVDPHAAAVVIESGLPVTVVPLDLTEQVVLTIAELRRLVQTRRNRVLSFIMKFTAQYMRYHKQTLGFEGAYLHDPMAVAIAIDPSLAKCASARVTVESKGRLTRGLTSAERRTRTEHGRTEIAVSIDREKFVRLFHSRVLTA